MVQLHEIPPIPLGNGENGAESHITLSIPVG